MTLIPWWCLFLHVMGLNGHIYRHGKSWNGYNFHTYPHPAKKPVVPRDIMVDVINNVGLKLLAIHNEYNENNIAISPYGALSVIIALGEGLEGDAIYEIQQATHIPNDISVIRVGLRDIHRHLKSYFIPKEGFLAGLTLNHEKVTLRPEYEEILRFYGYDTSNFNNALYPPPESSRMPHTTIDESTTTEAPITTDIERVNTVEITTEGVTTSTIYPEITTSVLSTIKPITVPETTTNVVTTEETTLSVQQNTTTTLPQTTEAKAIEVTTVQIPRTTREAPTEPNTEKETTSVLSTTTESTTTSILTTLLISTQESTERDVTQTISTTREIPTTKMMTTTEILTTSTTTSELTEPGTTTDFITIQSSGLTTNSPTSPLLTTQVSTLPTAESTVGSIATELPTTITEVITNSIDTTTSATGDISTLFTDSTTTSINTDTTTLPTTDTTTVNTTPNGSSAEKESRDNEIDNTNSSASDVGFGGISKRKVRSDEIKPNQTNVIWLNTRGEKFVSKRTSRSVVDYIIARLYDDQFNFDNSHEPYIPEEPPSFLIYGKFREYNINFMKYNTILPFHYEPHLNALALSFPLDSTKYYLLLLLPVDETGIDKLICDLRLNGSLKYIIANLKYRHVVATIPSFMLKGYVTLTPSFQKLGIRKVFEPRQADFAPMTSQRGIYVTNIEQAITVTIRNYVDPNTIQGQRNLHRYDPVHFKADHPFLYFVIDSDIHVTLMAGKIVNPLNSRIS